MLAEFEAPHRPTELAAGIAVVITINAAQRNVLQTTIAHILSCSLQLHGCIIARDCIESGAWLLCEKASYWRVRKKTVHSYTGACHAGYRAARAAGGSGRTRVDGR